MPKLVNVDRIHVDRIPILKFGDDDHLPEGSTFVRLYLQGALVIKPNAGAVLEHSWQKGNSLCDRQLVAHKRTRNVHGSINGTDPPPQLSCYKAPPQRICRRRVAIPIVAGGKGKTG